MSAAFISSISVTTRRAAHQLWCSGASSCVCVDPVDREVFACLVPKFNLWRIKHFLRTLLHSDASIVLSHRGFAETLGDSWNKAHLGEISHRARW